MFFNLMSVKTCPHVSGECLMMAVYVESVFDLHVNNIFTTHEFVHRAFVTMVCVYY